MKCLALDTTTDICSIAVADDNGLIAQYDFAHKMDLSRRLMPNIASMLRDSGFQLKDMEAVGVSLGPGSFTGLRIGATTAKTLAHALGIPIAGVVTLDLLAHQFDYMESAVVCPLIKVRKGEVYYSVYHGSKGSIERVSDYGAGPVKEVVSALGSEASERIVFCGDGLQESREALAQALGEHALFAPQGFSYAKASTLAAIALEKIARGEGDDPLTLVPFYIRRSAPEMRLECPRQGG